MKHEKFTEIWYNPEIKSLEIVDRTNGRVQSFTLEKEYTEKRLSYNGDLDPSEYWGRNGWKRKKSFETITTTDEEVKLSND